jgi:hypothetical protein
VTDETPNTTAPDPEPNPAAPDPATSRPGRAVSSAETRPRRPDYRGEELDPERGPGLGCFWFQMAVLGFFIVLIPIGLELNWPFELLALLLFVVIGLLLLTGQSMIFLLRLVAADRRSQGRRRPLASSTKTVGELEDEQERTPGADAGAPEAPAPAPADPSRDSESMIREAGVAETPTTEADTPGVAAGPLPDVDAARIGAGGGAPARPDADDATVEIEAAGGDDAATVVRRHGSSPESHELDASRTRDTVTDAAADADAAAPDEAPDEASPEEPDAGVRQ